MPTPFSQRRAFPLPFAAGFELLPRPRELQDRFLKGGSASPADPPELDQLDPLLMLFNAEHGVLREPHFAGELSPRDPCSGT